MDNDKIRLQIKNMMEDGFLRGAASDISSIALTENFFHLYSNIIASNHEYKDVILNYLWNVTQVLYLDAYKYLNYKDKSLILIDEEYEIFKKLNNIDGELDLRTKFSDEPDIYSLMIIYCYNYICLSNLTKYLSFKALNKDDNIYLRELCPLHENDLKNSPKTINLDYIMKEYLKLSIKAHNEEEDYDEYEIIQRLDSFIKRLYLLDKNSFKIIINEIISINNINVINSLTFIDNILHKDEYLINLLEKTINNYYKDDEKVLKKKN